jgi:hypothetical protein
MPPPRRMNVSAQPKNLSARTAVQCQMFSGLEAPMRFASETNSRAKSA